MEKILRGKRKFYIIKVRVKVNSKIWEIKNEDTREEDNVCVQKSVNCCGMYASRIDDMGY